MWSNLESLVTILGGDGGPLIEISNIIAKWSARFFIVFYSYMLYGIFVPEEV